mmetsp:Transcript_8542/g.12634  ORF Transcript_8542/g.12634 Transcript_8542/m.12634 type:complete len:178 (-) Transcript_8542:303-836(-)|eukprot:CAMPEP_0196811912 /NCGR_PEP_ID=MMETSP1362-20130617/20132_1 /TAXON_ID=163516 /ORGANISM="Leptocylindrus danicus, Strain CCMP1856" /LENGTH=177 /DNA_ID=CAMNT_0042187315 /DNA_START=50 /DNA_END=583 /DNA_ORIENTATION=-
MQPFLNINVVATFLVVISHVHFSNAAFTTHSKYAGSTTSSLRRFLPALAVNKKYRNFDEMLSKYGEQPVLVDFHAKWCGPCRLMEKELSEASNHLGEENLQVFRIDTEKFPSLGSRFGIDALPTTILFKDGKPVHRFVGVIAAAKIIEQIGVFMEENSSTIEQCNHIAGDFLDSVGA